MSRLMRLIVLFDLPVVKREDRKKATEFRNFLLKDGYTMLQYSVYCRVCNGYDSIIKHEKRLNSNLPEKGSVRAISITDKQYATMKFLVGKPKITEVNNKGDQLTFF